MSGWATETAGEPKEPDTAVVAAAGQGVKPLGAPESSKVTRASLGSSVDGAAGHVQAPDVHPPLVASLVVPGGTRSLAKVSSQVSAPSSEVPSGEVTVVEPGSEPLFSDMAGRA